SPGANAVEVIDARQAGSAGGARRWRCSAATSECTDRAAAMSVISVDRADPVIYRGAGDALGQAQRPGGPEPPGSSGDGSHSARPRPLGPARGEARHASPPVTIRRTVRSGR